MIDQKSKHLLTPIDISKDKPLSCSDINTLKKQLRSTFRSYLNLILGLFVLGSVVSYRAISLDFDKQFELLKICLYSGFALGLFTGLMTSGSLTRRVKMIIVSIIVSTSASLFCSMLITLMIGNLVNWISSISILGGALGCIWILTQYDRVVKQLESLEFVTAREFRMIKKSGKQYHEINHFNHKIARQKRIPTFAEFWAIEEWISKQSN